MNLKESLTSIFLVLIIVMHTSAQDLEAENFQNNKDIEKAISTNLDAWHKAAAEANFSTYFNLMTTNAVFIGTDASEHWGVKAFKAFSKPHFDSGKAWTFTALERHIYIDDDKIAWFDELLKTQMGVCRGSGILKYQEGTWKIAQYVLSATIPNDKMSAVTTLKAEADSKIVKAFIP
ncbi:nuclear transport factor 2 family protein [Formosa sp. PL04]|uniref:nuclear transport factor 2 family protein n=1 Tax=Formosa sp. PL04 TaxID=3081755 RepID=UPI002982595F|nr:nuclear transport factor 2 family protein [Formosa sp. PL04]MDW5291001.1 nuclear transport factor 2 family protein [Formosa sp. PL04]